MFVAFTPSLVFSSLAKTVNFQDIISWYVSRSKESNFVISTCRFEFIYLVYVCVQSDTLLPTHIRWFMPVNIGITFLVGSIFGWVAVKIVRPKPYIADLMIAMCSSGTN